MNNSTELITGALTGTGRATALAFAREGRRFVVSGSLPECRASHKLGEIRYHESFLWHITTTVNPREDAQERDLFMPIMEFNDKLTRIVRGRTIQLVAQEEGLVTIVFHDYSTMRVKAAGGPTMNMLGEGRIESAGDGGAELNLVGEDGSTATCD
jgi:hypothetical protein